MALGISAGTWVTGGAILGSALLGAGAAQSAGSLQASAANNATAMQKQMFDQTQQNLQPYMQPGGTTLASLVGKLNNGQLGGNFTAADYQANQDPGYQFQLQQGQQALLNSQAAQDGAMSGAALKQLINFNQQTANTGYQSAYNRWLQSQQNTYGQLMGVSGLGENAAAGLGNTGAGYAQGMSNTITGAANASAAGTVGAANAITGALNNGLGYYQLSDLLHPGMTNVSGYGYVPNANLNNSSVTETGPFIPS